MRVQQPPGVSLLAVTVDLLRACSSKRPLRSRVLPAANDLSDLFLQMLNRFSRPPENPAGAVAPVRWTGAPPSWQGGGQPAVADAPSQSLPWRPSTSPQTRPTRCPGKASALRIGLADYLTLRILCVDAGEHGC
jgi:hypothetical protein